MKKMVLGIIASFFIFLISDIPCHAMESDSFSSRIYGATIWSLKQETLYTDDSSYQVEPGTPLLVLYEDGDKLFAHDGNASGFVNKTNIMINLPDVMQSEVTYDLLYAYDCGIVVHGNPIEGLTHIGLYKYAARPNGEFLVPLLYPVAEVLYDVQNAASELGYNLKIYDTYRPGDVGHTMYDLTKKYLDKHPEYVAMMTEKVDDSYYGLGWFLADGVSTHTQGTAIDLTLTDAETGEELEMQSLFDELSTRSVVSQNNENSNLLQELMVSHGFKILKSEWWHFDYNKYAGAYGWFHVRPFERTAVDTDLYEYDCIY